MIPFQENRYYFIGSFRLPPGVHKRPKRLLEEIWYLKIEQKGSLFYLQPFRITSGVVPTPPSKYLTLFPNRNNVKRWYQMPPLPPSPPMFTLFSKYVFSCVVGGGTDWAKVHFRKGKDISLLFKLPLKESSSSWDRMSHFLNVKRYMYMARIFPSEPWDKQGI